MTAKKSLLCLALASAALFSSTAAFSPLPSTNRCHPRRDTPTQLFSDKPKNILEDIKGMFQNLDDVVDDFVMKRMGAGEQWYGKRKYNPSGRVDGDYNGMGRSSHYAIEIARIQKEALEERKLRRLEEEEAARKGRLD